MIREEVNAARAYRNSPEVNLEQEIWQRMEESASHLEDLVQRVHARGESVILELKELVQEFEKNDMTSEMAKHLSALASSFEQLDQAIKKDSRLLSDRNYQISQLKICQSELLVNIENLSKKLSSIPAKSPYQESVSQLGQKICDHISNPNPIHRASQRSPHGKPNW